MNPSAILGLISDLYVQIQGLQTENETLKENLTQAVEEARPAADAPLEGPEAASEMARRGQ